MTSYDSGANGMLAGRLHVRERTLRGGRAWSRARPRRSRTGFQPDALERGAPVPLARAERHEPDRAVVRRRRVVKKIAHPRRAQAGRKSHRLRMTASRMNTRNPAYDSALRSSSGTIVLSTPSRSSGSHSAANVHHTGSRAIVKTVPDGSIAFPPPVKGAAQYVRNLTRMSSRVRYR